jgi:hypothetical protein
MDRRKFIGVAASPLWASTVRKKAQPRRLLFNWDLSMIHCFGRAALGNPQGPLTRDQFIELAFGPIEDAAVDTVLFSFGSGNVAEYESKVLEWPGQADRFEFPAAKAWHGGLEVDPQDQYLNPKSLADAGHNPPGLVVRECRKRGINCFVSLRMNDCHDGQHPRGVLPNPELPTFKRLNADWLLDDLDWWTALDYRRPQVRALKLRVIEEFFDRWDFDGIELDWLRHTMNFPRGTDRENGKYLTEFLQAVRRSLEDRARKRGRPIELAVRIPERVEWCLEGGFEIDKWLNEGLVDFLTLGQGLTEAPGMGDFRALMKKRSIPIYASLYSYGNGYRVSPDEVIRGEAATLWNDGADGLYLFNWAVSGNWRKPVLSQIADRKAVQTTTRRFVLLHRVEPVPREAGGDYIRYNSELRTAPVPFVLTTAESVKKLAIPAFGTVGKTELWVAFEYERKGDLLHLALNGKPLTTEPVATEGRLETVGDEMRLPPHNGMLGMTPRASYDMRFKALRLPVSSALLRPGRNELQIELRKRGPGTESPLRVTRVELRVEA